jgi:hypothetical protein
MADSVSMIAILGFLKTVPKNFKFHKELTSSESVNQKRRTLLVQLVVGAGLYLAVD